MLSSAEAEEALNRIRPRLVMDDLTSDRQTDTPLARGPRIVHPTTEPEDPQPSGDALILHTSGTSGQPKPVILTHDAFLRGLSSFTAHVSGRRVESFGSGRRRPVLVAFPLFHLAGIYNMLIGLAIGRPLLLMPRFDAVTFAALVKEWDLRAVSLNPTMIQMILDAASQIGPEALDGLRFVRSGSAPLPPRMVDDFRQRFGVGVFNGYGQTETCGEVIGWNVEDMRQFGEAKSGSVGRPHPGVSVRFVAEGGEDVQRNAVGELCVKTPAVMRGYLADEGERSDRFTRDGYLRTGDIGHRDDDGFIWLTGRRSDVIVTGGFKIMPEEVEGILESHQAVSMAMVVGVADVRLGEVPLAYVVFGYGETALPSDLVAFCRARLSHYKCPRDVIEVPKLPQNAQGKLIRRRRSEWPEHTPDTAVVR